MTEPISAAHPNLQLARKRLQRMLRVWALLFAAMGVTAWVAMHTTHPLTSVGWLLAALLFALGSQPAFLVLAAVIWGISITSLIPGAAGLLGPDPLSILFAGGLLEQIVLIFIRVVFAVMAMNQFLFYRMLYGTERMTGLDESLPDIPEVIPNKTDLLAQISAGIAAVAMIIVAIGWLVDYAGAARYLLHGAAIAATYAVGLGLGCAFSPTDKRGSALLSVFLGALTFLLALTSAPNV
ncbi:MAG: hypothetical protein PVF85_14620 [Anaerolineales bacterium]